MTDEHDKLLQLALAVRLASKSSLWKTDMEMAIENHSDAVEALYQELDRQIDAREMGGKPLRPQRAAPDPRKEARRELAAILRQELPGLINSLLDDR